MLSKLAMERSLHVLSGIFLALHSALFVIGICSNVTLLAAVYFRTPKALKTYSVMIKAGALNDIAAICIDLFTMNRILAVILGIPGNMFYIVSIGPCSLIAPQACYWGYCFEVASILYSIYCMAASFVFRLWVLHQRTPKDGNVLLIMIVIFIPPAAAMYAFTFAQGDAVEIRQVVNGTLPECLSDEGVLTGQSGMTPLSMIVVTYAAVSPVAAYTICLVIRRKALTMHTMIPLVNIVACLVYMIMFFGIYRHAAMEKAIFLIATIPSTLAPLCTLFYVEPYRQFVSRRFRRISLISEPVSSSMTFATIALRKTTDQ